MYLTIIPARGGSKELPNKNLQKINGKTLVERSILAAQKIPNNRIIVSSDSIEILHYADKCNVEPLVRSDANSTDIATSEDVILEVLSLINSESDIITLLQPTSPFIDVKVWEKSLTNMSNDNRIDSMFSAIEKNEFIWEYINFWKPVGHDKSIRLPRQTQSQRVIETGSFYIFRKTPFEKEKTRFCGVTQPALTQIWSSFDIDSQSDLDFCNVISHVIDTL